MVSPQSEEIMAMPRYVSTQASGFKLLVLVYSQFLFLVFKLAFILTCRCLFTFNHPVFFMVWFKGCFATQSYRIKRK